MIVSVINGITGGKSTENPVLKTCQSSLKKAADLRTREMGMQEAGTSTMGLSCRRGRAWGAPQGVTVGATVVNLIIKDLEKGLNGKMAKFAAGAVLFRVTKVTAVEGPRWFE